MKYSNTTEEIIPAAISQKKFSKLGSEYRINFELNPAVSGNPAEDARKNIKERNSGLLFLPSDLNPAVSFTEYPVIIRLMHNIMPREFIANTTVPEINAASPAAEPEIKPNNRYPACDIMI